MVSCDIGTSTIKIVVSQIENNNLNILGVGVAHTEGVKKGQIVDIEQVVQSIHEAVEQAERMVGMRIESVHVGIGANAINVQHCEGVVAINSPSREVTDEDKARVRIQAELVQIPQDREIIDLIPLKYKVDEVDNIVDPKGMSGIRLEMKGILITGLKTVIHNSLRAVNRAGLNVAGIVFLPYSSASMVLSNDEQEMGSVLIDLGGGVATVSIFKETELVHAFYVPLGGDTLTRDLSLVLKTSAVDAEKIKVKYGNAFINFDMEDETVMVPMLDSDKQQVVSQVMIAEICEARLTEIFEIIQSELKRLNLYDVVGNYVLTGGVVKMPGVVELAEYIFQNRVRTAIPSYISVREPQYTASVGILAYTFRRAKLDGLSLRSCVGHLVDDVNNVSSNRVRNREFEKSEKKEGSGKFSLKGFITNFFE